MKLLLTLIWLFNIVDTMSTVILCNSYNYTETNPFMRLLLVNQNLFIAVKITVMSVVLAVLWKNRGSRLAVVASWIGFVMYGGISIYYIFLLSTL